MTNASITHVFTIPENRIERMREKVNKINERLVKNKLSPVIAEFGEVAINKIKTTTGNFVDIKSSILKIHRETLDKHNRPLAVVAHTSLNQVTDVMSHTFYGEVTALEAQQINTPDDRKKCDHCNTSRPRINIYTIRNDEGFMRVGSGCMKDVAFDGFDKWIKAVDAIKDAAEAASTINLLDIEGMALVRVDDYLKAAVEHLEENEYEPDRIHGVGSAFLVFSEQLAESDLPAGQRKQYAPEIIAKANAITTHYKTYRSRPEDAANSFMINVNNLLDDGWLTVSLARKIMGAVAGYKKYEARLKQQLASAHVGAKHYGAVKEKFVARGLHVDYVDESYGQFGLTTLIKMSNAEGLLFQYRKTGETDIAKGDVVNLAGTVKKQSSWYSGFHGKDVKVTEVTRCTFPTDEELLEAEAAASKKQSKRSKPESAGVSL